MRRGVTLLEVVTAITIVGAVVLFALPSLAAWLDRLAVSRAAGELAMFYHRARWAAQFRAQPVRLEFGAERLRATFEGATDSLFLDLPGPMAHGVVFHATRAVIRLGPTGLGYGAANTKLVVRRGAAAESLTTSRLGRLRRW